MKINPDELVDQKIIDAATAQRIKEFYSYNKPNHENRLLRVVSLIGVVLVSLGLLLIIRYNWENLPRSFQLGLSLVPLLIGHGIGVFTLTKKSESSLWHDISAVSILFGIGIAILIVVDLYSFSGTFQDILKWWIILALPLIFIFRSPLASLLIWAGIIWYLLVITNPKETQSIIYALAFISIAIIPFVNAMRRRPETNITWAWHHLLLPLAGIAFLFCTAPHFCERLVLFHFLLYFLILTVVFESKIMEDQRWVISYKTYAVIGTFIIAFFLSFQSIWKNTNVSSWAICTKNSNFVFSIISSLAIVVLLIYAHKKFKLFSLRKPDIEWLMFFLILITLFSFELGIVAHILVNVSILLSIAFIVKESIQEEHLGFLNFGLILLIIWIVCRFFESSISSIWKGIAFIALGIVCFLLNYLLIKRKQS